MSVIDPTQAGGVAGLAIDAPRAAVNLSDATQMENNFIDLMVAQIKFQDPTKPVDSTEFLNQFSAMSQVKSMENMARVAQSNLVLTDNLQTLTAAGLVGQDVTVAVDRVELSDEALAGEFQLAHPSGKTTLVLTDAVGKQTEVPLGPQAAGRVPFTLDAKALGLAEGEYAVSVETASGEAPQLELTGRVGHVRVSAEGPVLEVAGAGQVPFYQILAFGQQPASGLL
ncbi:flagellar hook assembly protein FlgD [Stutzerimonas urumqiensis]|uniref:flagellar hook capping FlgD N-terminal domain-containing protein n=1 Tax=Stutzerimonas urumqiensis TaxID=638269 RepID=UPI000EB4CBA2|nr:flagellar hook capping FlgD N-terminal domain-containing protein [Stutzerimonas urumqiensis]